MSRQRREEERGNSEEKEKDEGVQTQAAQEVKEEESPDAQATPEPEEEKPPEEVVGLQAAIAKVMDKIKWHEDEIEQLRNQIDGHERQIVDLRGSLEQHVGPLIGKPEVAAVVGKKPSGDNHQQRQTWRERKQRGEGPTTGQLIREALKGGKVLDTDQLKAYLEKRGCMTQPSVELSRLVAKHVLERSGRGQYKLVNEE